MPVSGRCRKSCATAIWWMIDGGWRCARPGASQLRVARVRFAGAASALYSLGCICAFSLGCICAFSLGCICDSRRRARGCCRLRVVRVSAALGGMCGPLVFTVCGRRGGLDVSRFRLQASGFRLQASGFRLQAFSPDSSSSVLLKLGAKCRRNHSASGSANCSSEALIWRCATANSRLPEASSTVHFR
jgi:hypothetical protein